MLPVLTAWVTTWPVSNWEPGSLVGMCVKGYTVRVVIGVCVCVYVCVWWGALEDKPQVKDEAWQGKGLGSS